MINKKEGYVKTEINGKFTISKISSDSNHYAEIELIYPNYGFINDVFEESITFFEKGSVRFLEPYINALEPLGDIILKKRNSFREVFDANLYKLNLISKQNDRWFNLKEFSEAIEFCYDMFMEECDDRYLGLTAKKYIKETIIHSMYLKGTKFTSYDISNFQNIIDNILTENDVILDLSQGDNIYLCGEQLFKKNGIK